MFDTPLNQSSKTRLPGTIACAVLSGLLASALPVSPCLAGDEVLPKAEEIIEKHIEALGGRAAHEKLRNRVTKGTFGVPGMGTPAKMTTYEEAPQKQYILIESETMGKIEAGCDGTTAWEMTTMTGPEIKEGEERATLLRSAVFNNVLHWKELYKSVECTGIEDVDGKPCYKVVMTPEEGNPETVYYDKDTFLVSKTETKMKTRMGTLPIVMTFSDRKRVDGILIPYKIVQEVVGVQKVEMITKSVEHNVKISPDRFKLPEEIQELAAAQKKETSE